MHGARDRQRLVGRAAASAPAGDPAFEQDLQRATDGGRANAIDEAAHAFQGIDQAVEVEGGVAAQFVGDGRDLLAADELIGEHDATDAEAAADHHLPDAGDGDAPGAVGKLLGEQLRRHGGLAVGRDPGVGQFEEAPHPAAVVVERRALDHRDRQRQVALEQVPAALADLAEAHRRRGRRQAFDAAVEGGLQQAVEIHGRGFLYARDLRSPMSPREKPAISAGLWDIDPAFRRGDMENAIIYCGRHEARFRGTTTNAGKCMETIASRDVPCQCEPLPSIFFQVSTNTDHRPAVAAALPARIPAAASIRNAPNPASTGRRSRAQRLRDYYWFCLEHVRAYNSAWNYCAGFSEADIEAQARAQACWERPTWRLGEWHTQRPEAAMAAFAEAFGIEGDAEAGDNRSRQRQERPPPAATDDKALAVLGLAPAATWAEIKARYKRLVKRYHPDANGGDRQAEERLKVINQAYSTLRKRPVAS